MPSSLEPVDLPLLVQSHESLGASHYLLALAAGRVPRWSPGQFAMIAPRSGRATVDPLLRRPFSIFNLAGSPAGSLQILYKVLGRGTGLLSGARAGDEIRCLAPLGRGFDTRHAGGERLLLVAGGIGSASLHPLALQDRDAGGQPLMLYGCRTAADLAGVRPTQEAGIDVRISTDDGSAGRKGPVSDLLEEFLATEGAAARGRWAVCVCGPTAMMKAAAAVAARHRLRCHVSLESPMACGFGVCVGCVVGTREGADAPLRYRRICVDGPVFDAAQVVW